jgi:hypothetical protein
MVPLAATTEPLPIGATGAAMLALCLLLIVGWLLLLTR